MPFIVTNDGYGQMCNKIFNQMNVISTGLEKKQKVFYYNFDRYTSFSYDQSDINDILIMKKKNILSKVGLLYCKKKADFRGYYLNINSQFSSEVFLGKNINFSKKIYISGWPFVNLRGLRKYKKEIEQFFSATQEMEKIMKEKLYEVKKGSILIGVHIRRGDYRNWRNGEYFFDDEIYKWYIDQLVKCFPNKNLTVFIFSNEVVNKSFFLDNNYDLIIPNGTAEEDFHLMTKMDYIIGPPSTFSGVASFLKNIPRYIIKERNKSIDLAKMKIWLMETDCDGN
ncbi:alpha-1,2-fucosyltransferase [uncultured Dubosiella sp.]|uniref:alpha-1,2-fucosyltransferase n=3 Tax=uncultured Dubosiella sp. TaxID=1937011 RepID=UPI002594E982|nr:alpha-1,2-fucosyltransferase [uncultured Dubosiella sp.]